MTNRGWDRDEVSDERKIGAKLANRDGGGQADLTSLLASLRRNGRDPCILEAGLGLPEGEYATLEDAYKRTPLPDLPKIRRRRV